MVIVEVNMQWTLTMLPSLKQSGIGNMRWQGIARPYSAEDVIRLRGSIKIVYTLALPIIFGGRQTLLLIATQLGWGHRPQEEIGHTASG